MIRGSVSKLCKNMMGKVSVSVSVSETILVKRVPVLDKGFSFTEI